MSIPLSPRPLLWLIVLIAVFTCSLLEGGDRISNAHDTPRELARLEPHFRESVLKGWRFFQTSYAKDGMACVHCHGDHGDIRRWAGAYPKVEPLDGTPYRVKTLEEVVSFALVKHTDMKASEVASFVNDIVSYISYWGYGTPVTPGRSESFPSPQQDMALLRTSVLLGEKLFTEHCRTCHVMKRGDKGPPLEKVIEGVTHFPRYVSSRTQVLSLQGFLSWHGRSAGRENNPLSPCEITHISAYLREKARGLTLHPGTLVKGVGGR